MVHHGMEHLIWSNAQPTTVHSRLDLTANCFLLVAVGGSRRSQAARPAASTGRGISVVGCPACFPGGAIAAQPLAPWTVDNPQSAIVLRLDETHSAQLSSGKNDGMICTSHGHVAGGSGCTMRCPVSTPGWATAVVAQCRQRLPQHPQTTAPSLPPT
jgi:hypothetical protein